MHAIADRDSPIDHPANAGLRRYREARDPRALQFPVARPDEVPSPYLSLGTHPDLVARLWDELQAQLPTDCRIVFAGRPALLHPVTHVVFGFASGTHTYALRLPEREREAAIAAGATRIANYPGGRQPSFDHFWYRHSTVAFNVGQDSRLGDAGSECGRAVAS